MGDTCVIKKTMCPPGYNHSDILITHELGQMIYMMYTEFSHCISEPVGKVIYMCMCLRVCIYIYIYIYIYIIYVNIYIYI